MPKLKAALVLLQLSFLLIFAISASAHAGSISLQTQSTLRVTKLENSLILEVDFSIKNIGDDSALGVYPSLGKNTWQWRGKQQTINPQETKTWKLKKEISLESLKCRSECLDLALPVQGSIPLVSYTFYKDQGQQQYTSVQVLEIKVPPLADKNISNNILEWGSIDSYRDGNSLQFEVQGRLAQGNVSKILMRVFSSKHLVADEPQKVLQVAEDGIIIGENMVTDVNNLANGQYPIFVVLEWEADGYRESKILSTMFATDIAPSENSETSKLPTSLKGFPLFLVLSLGYILLTGLLGYFSAYLTPKGNKSKG